MFSIQLLYSELRLFDNLAYFVEMSFHGFNINITGLTIKQEMGSNFFNVYKFGRALSDCITSVVDLPTSAWRRRSSDSE